MPRFFMTAVARALKARYGSTIHLYCSSAEQVDYYTARNGEGLYASITDGDLLMKKCIETELEERAVFERAAAFEARLGVTYNELSVANRHLGRGYALGGFYFPRSRQSEITTAVQLAHAYNEQLAFWDRELADKDITLVLNGGKEVAVVSRNLALPFRNLVGARYRNNYYWAWNEFHENPSIQDTFGRGVRVPGAVLDAPYHTHAVNRSNALGSFGMKTLVRKLGFHTARSIYWHLRGYEAARNYYPLEMLRFQWRGWSEFRRMRRLRTTTLSDLNGRPFVFFPLHLEPEAALQVISPEYFYQLSAIAALARDLPAGVTLAVKEQFAAVGRRPADFYRQILEFKNVVLLDTWELGLDVVTKADAVATICGTAGMEAAIFGKPVIAFGKHNNYNFLPHVMVVTKESELKGYLKAALDGPRDPKRTREDGQRYLEAVIASSFDMKDYSRSNLRGFDDDAVEYGLRALVQSLSGLEQSKAFAV